MFMETSITNEMEFNRFGFIAVILLIVGCLGGLTIGLGAIENTFSLIAVVIPTMITLSFLIAVAPMRWIMIAATTSVIVDSILILYYLLF
jgi:hypothetical protein